MMKMGSSFKKIRENKGYTQKKVSKNIISQGAYSKFEKGLLEIKANSYIKILNKLHMDSEEFVFIANNYQYTESEKLLRRFFTLPYNDVKQLKKIRREILKYLEVNEDILLQDITVICKAMISLAQTNDITLSQKMVSPIWERLSEHHNWYLNDINLINVMLFLFPLDTAIEMTKRVLRRLELYKGFRGASRIKINYTLNLALLLIKHSNYETAMGILDDLLNSSIKNMHYVTLALCFSRKSICLHHLGNGLDKEYLRNAKELSLIYEDKEYWKQIESEFYIYC